MQDVVSIMATVHLFVCVYSFGCSLKGTSADELDRFPLTTSMSCSCCTYNMYNNYGVDAFLITDCSPSMLAWQ